MRRLTTIFILLGVLTLISCSKEPADLLIGSWKMEEYRVYEHATRTETDRTPEYFIYTFQKDGIGSRDADVFSYTVSGDKLLIQYTPTSKATEYTIKNLTRDRLEIVTDMYFSQKLVYTATYIFSKRK